VSPPQDEPDLTTTRYHQLNERFYAAEPADYLRIRLVSLLALAGRPDEVLELLRAGVNHGGVTARISDDSEIDQESLSRYVSIESQVLLHHAGETLVRLYLAHRDHPPCPWLELSREKHFGPFKKRVEEEIGRRRPALLADEVAWIFLGCREAERSEAERGEDSEAWSAAASNLVLFLRTFVDRWLAESATYNALKHGLAALPGNASLLVADDDGRGHSMADGASIELLTSGRWDDGRRVWSATTRWIDISECLALVEVASHMISSLWQIARMRYADADAGDNPLFFPAKLRPIDLREKTAGARELSIRLLEERR
jgi:hypothetical protein